MRRRAAEHLQSLGIDVDPRTPMGALPLGLQQLVELARVLFSGARIIILDEPTSALSPPEVERLFALLRRLREAGRSIVFISHFLDDVLAICDRVTVFRNGRTVATEACAAVDKRWIIDRMIGAGHEGLEESYLVGHPAAQPAGCEGRAGGRRAEPRRAPITTCRSACTRARCWGSMGSSVPDSSNWRARCSAGCRRSAGAIALDGRTVRLSSTARARRAGMAFLPESRRMMLFAAEPVFKNVTIAILDRIDRLWLRPGAERAIAERHVERLRIRPPRRRTARSARCPAATSRRWRWRSG